MSKGYYNDWVKLFELAFDFGMVCCGVEEVGAGSFENCGPEVLHKFWASIGSPLRKVFLVLVGAGTSAVGSMAVGKLVVWELPVGELAAGDLTAGMFAVDLS
ncbi:uncharacterized protein N7458_009713 [Penicillium daleae]|uniref:Uncharacterized protein n=1 Tax=Penicillium daleae TaxID=63821 RepID=A0AAD6FYQ3_9EURO|nr:uncharacterized protein N7458_009713 [Penicillium daleae]KAJ5438715.1 hypothetical protein N7458_009713 [Penicillium daleae]